MAVNVVLVRTEYSGNVGSTARAMANMGVERLILIDSKCRLDHEAKQMAAGAQAPLANVTLYPSWRDFYAQEGDGIRVAFTRRGGRKRKVTPWPEQSARLSNLNENIYLIFGPEADGLDSEDLAFVNFTCSLPLYGDFKSLNLAQAVLLALYIFKSHQPPQTVRQSPPAQALYFPDELIREWLTNMGFDIQARRSSAYLTLRRLFLQNLPTRHEIQVLEAILQQNIRKLKKLKSLGLAAEELAHDRGDVVIKDI